MEPPQPLEIGATPLTSSEFRDWAHLPDLALMDVLHRLVPCLPSLSAFAATCRPWWRFFRAAVSTLRSRIPPLFFCPQNCNKIASFRAFALLVIREPVASPLTAFGKTVKSSLSAVRSKFLSSSRGHLILLDRPRGLLLVLDALTGAERLAVRLPSPGFPYDYACLTPTHLLLFLSKHAFASLPFPAPNPTPEWTHHRLPRAASFIAAVIDFRGRGRVLGVTDLAELLEFRLDADTPDQAVQLLPATGLPDSAAFERWRFGPRLFAAGERLLLLLIMWDPDGGGSMTQMARVQKASVYALDMAAMRWEQVDNIREYSLFVDCAGRSAVACVEAGDCGVEANRVYFLAPRYCPGPSGWTWKAFPPGSDALEATWPSFISPGRQWPLQIWVYPRILF